MYATTQTARPNVISEKSAWIGQSAAEHHIINNDMMNAQRLAERRSFKRSEKRGIAMSKLSVRERFFTKVKRMESGCHEWQSWVLPNGYGQFSYQGKPHYAHRIAYLLHHGEIPEGAYILHNCDNRKCVNPEHIWAGTFDENMQDMVNKGRQAAGTKNFHAKLKPEQVIAIRSAIGTHREIAECYGVTQGLISMIRSGKIWRTV